MRGYYHARTGNFHTLLIFKTKEELEIVRDLVHRMVGRALALDGTCKAPLAMHSFPISPPPL